MEAYFEYKMISELVCIGLGVAFLIVWSVYTLFK